MSNRLEIVYYSDLKDKADLMHLWAQSFVWLGTPKLIDA